ncbi:transposase [Thermoanaerobacter uzonensis]|nr:MULTISPECIES: transposase [Thermoanaerobacter]
MTAWNSRPLREKSFPFVIVDAMVIRVREEGRVLWTQRTNCCRHK